MRLMYDSVDPYAIPRNATMVGGYTDGIYAWTDAEWAMFPNSVHVKFSAIGTDSGTVGDVEPGCIWPVENAVPWVRKRRRAGVDPTVYVNELNHWAACRAAFARAGEPEPHWMVSNYDGNSTFIPNDAVARQFAHPPNSGGHYDPATKQKTAQGHYDISAVRDFWPGVDTHAPGGGGGNDEGDEDDMVAIHETLPASSTPNCVTVQCPVVGMSEPLPDGPETWAQVQIAVPNADARIWGLYAITTPGVAKGKGEAILLAGPGKLPSGEVGETEVDPAPLGHDLYVPYWLPRGTFAVTAWYDSLRPVSLLITGGKTRKVSAAAGA